MENLKITFYLQTQSMLYRYLSIDSILINLHYNRLRKKGLIKKDEFVDVSSDLENISKFLDVQNVVLSGSIWYVDKDETIFYSQRYFSKKVSEKDFLKYFQKKPANYNSGRGKYKNYYDYFDILYIPKLYFYVRGDRDYIEDLLKDCQYIGKKASLGYGIVKGFKVETIEEDKSFMLNHTTASKPLPCLLFNIKSKRIAYYRVLPPYHLRDKQVSCYMPPTSLMEHTDNSYSKYYDCIKPTDYITATYFVSNAMQRFAEDYETPTLTEKVKKERCALCNRLIINELATKKKDSSDKTFTDFNWHFDGDYYCQECAFTITGRNRGKIANKIFLTDAIVLNSKADFFNLKPPYVAISGNNKRHIAFKSKVSLSSTIMALQHDDRTFFVDLILAKEALSEYLKIKEQYEKFNILPIIAKQAKDVEYLGQFKLKTEEKEKYLELTSDFLKKYDTSVRFFLNNILKKHKKGADSETTD